MLFDSAVIETNNLQGIIIKTQKDMVSHQFEKKTGLSLIEHNKKYLRILFNTVARRTAILSIPINSSGNDFMNFFNENININC